MTIDSVEDLSDRIYIPTCSEIQTLKNELNEIYKNGSLHTVSLRLGDIFFEIERIFI